MIASVLTLDVKEVQKLQLCDEYSVHRVVYSLFPGNARRFLYYRHPSSQERKIKVLILSETPPQIPEYGRIESKMVHQSFLEHEMYAFKVRLNPVIRTQRQAKSIRSVGNLVDWFTSKQEQWGFVADVSRLELTDIGVTRIDAKGQRLVFNECTYSGVLKVVDRNLFIESFRTGLGRGKGFGFGFLQLQPVY